MENLVLSETQFSYSADGVLGDRQWVIIPDGTRDVCGDFNARNLDSVFGEGAIKTTIALEDHF